MFAYHVLANPKFNVLRLLAMPHSLQDPRGVPRTDYEQEEGLHTHAIHAPTNCCPALPGLSLCPRLRVFPYTTRRGTNRIYYFCLIKGPPSQETKRKSKRLSIETNLDESLGECDEGAVLIVCRELRGERFAGDELLGDIGREM